jgi:nucleoside-diphosphate-sugar epimerase
LSRVLVTGADGFIGRALCPALIHSGYDVSASVRNTESAGSQHLKTLDKLTLHPVSDLGPECDWSVALEGAEFVVHLAARVHVVKETHIDPVSAFWKINAEGTRHLARSAAKAGLKRMVYLSTIKVNGERTYEDPFRENDTPNPKDPYAISKWEAEKALALVTARKSGLETTILRPPLVYGPEVKGNFLSLLRLCNSAAVLPFQSVDNRRSMISLYNLIDVIICCLTHPKAGGETYLVRDEDVSTAELIRRISFALGKQTRLFPMPTAALSAVGPIFGIGGKLSKLLDSLVIDDQKIRQDIGWRPPYAMDEELAETAAWFHSAQKL